MKKGFNSAKKLILTLTILSVLCSPSMALAQTPVTGGDIKNIEAITETLNTLKTLDGFVVADLVELRTGKPLVTDSNTPDFDTSELCRLGALSLNTINEAMDLVSAPYITFVEVTNPVSSTLNYMLGSTHFIGLCVENTSDLEYAKSRQSEAAKEIEALLFGDQKSLSKNNAQ